MQKSAPTIAHPKASDLATLLAAPIYATFLPLKPAGMSAGDRPHSCARVIRSAKACSGCA